MAQETQSNIYHLWWRCCEIQGAYERKTALLIMNLTIDNLWNGTQSIKVVDHVFTTLKTVLWSFLSTKCFFGKMFQYIAIRMPCCCFCHCYLSFVLSSLWSTEIPPNICSKNTMRAINCLVTDILHGNLLLCSAEVRNS